MTIEDARLKELILLSHAWLGFDDPEYKDTADALTELLRLRQEGRWIPVTERLPEYDTDILLASPIWPKVYLGYYWRHSEEWFGRYSAENPYDVLPDNNPTHWRPLPAAPEGGPK